MAKITTTDYTAGRAHGTFVEIYEDNGEQVVKAIESSIESALEEIGLSAERFAKTETPVDTGRLRNSITHAIDSGEDAVYVGTNVEYAPYVELGTWRTGYKGVQMLTHAAQNHGDHYRSILKKHLENA